MDGVHHRSFSSCNPTIAEVFSHSSHFITILPKKSSKQFSYIVELHPTNCWFQVVYSNKDCVATEKNDESFQLTANWKIIRSESRKRSISYWTTIRLVSWQFFAPSIMAVPPQLIICAAIKIVIILLTIVVLILLNPEYTVTYISVNYEIVLIYIISALTLLYCVVSLLMYATVQRRKKSGTGPPSLTNCSITEVVFAGAGMIIWMLVCGIGGTVSQRTIIETGEPFGWLAACAGIIVTLFLAIMALSCLNLMTEKVFSTERNSKIPATSQYHYGSRIWIFFFHINYFEKKFFPDYFICFAQLIGLM